jgi:hypothetical protein
MMAEWVPPAEIDKPVTQGSSDMRALDQKDVVRLLRSEVNRAGGQQRWANQNGVAPSAISMVLTGDRPPNKKILSALKLRKVVVFERVDE